MHQSTSQDSISLQWPGHAIFSISLILGPDRLKMVQIINWVAWRLRRKLSLKLTTNYNIADFPIQLKTVITNNHATQQIACWLCFSTSLGWFISPDSHPNPTPLPSTSWFSLSEIWRPIVHISDEYYYLRNENRLSNNTTVPPLYKLWNQWFQQELRRIIQGPLSS